MSWCCCVSKGRGSSRSDDQAEAGSNKQQEPEEAAMSEAVEIGSMENLVDFFRGLDEARAMAVALADDNGSISFGDDLTGLIVDLENFLAALTELMGRLPSPQAMDDAAGDRVRTTLTTNVASANTTNTTNIISTISTTTNILATTTSAGAAAPAANGSLDRDSILRQLVATRGVELETYISTATLENIMRDNMMTMPKKLAEVGRLVDEIKRPTDLSLTALLENFAAKIADLKKRIAVTEQQRDSAISLLLKAMGSKFQHFIKAGMLMDIMRDDRMTVQDVVTTLFEKMKEIFQQVKSFGPDLSSMSRFQENILCATGGRDDIRMLVPGSVLPIPEPKWEPVPKSSPGSSVFVRMYTQVKRVLKQAVRRVRQLLWNKTRFIFFCPVTRRLMPCGKAEDKLGYDQVTPTSLLKKLAPVLYYGSLAVKVALATQGLGFVIPTIDIYPNVQGNDMLQCIIQSIQDKFQHLVDDVEDVSKRVKDGEPSYAETVTAVWDDKAEDALSNLRELLAREELGEKWYLKLSSHRAWKPSMTGLVLIEHEASSTFLWVSKCSPPGCVGGSHTCGEHPFKMYGVDALGMKAMKNDLTEAQHKFYGMTSQNRQRRTLREAERLAIVAEEERRLEVEAAERRKKEEEEANAKAAEERKNITDNQREAEILARENALRELEAQRKREAEKEARIKEAARLQAEKEELERVAAAQEAERLRLLAEALKMERLRKEAEEREREDVESKTMAEEERWKRAADEYRTRKDELLNRMLEATGHFRSKDKPALEAVLIREEEEIARGRVRAGVKVKVFGTFGALDGLYEMLDETTEIGIRKYRKILDTKVLDTKLPGGCCLEYHPPYRCWAFKWDADRYSNNAWMHCPVEYPCLPEECPLGAWQTAKGNKWIAMPSSDSIKVEALSKDDVEEALKKEEKFAERRLSKSNLDAELLIRAKERERARTRLEIVGAIGPNSGLINGVYRMVEDDTVYGLKIYRNEANVDRWLEFRPYEKQWQVKSAVHRGTNVCWAYCAAQQSPCVPEHCGAGQRWQYSDGHRWLQSSISIVEPQAGAPTSSIERPPAPAWATVFDVKGTGLSQELSQALADFGQGLNDLSAIAFARPKFRSVFVNWLNEFRGVLTSSSNGIGPEKALDALNGYVGNCENADIKLIHYVPPDMTKAIILNAWQDNVKLFDKLSALDSKVSDVLRQTVKWGPALTTLCGKQESLLWAAREAGLRAQVPGSFLILPGQIDYEFTDRDDQFAVLRQCTRQTMNQVHKLSWRGARIVFFCPVTLRLMPCGKDGRGYIVTDENPTPVLKALAPLAKYGTTLLKVALATQCIHFAMPVAGFLRFQAKIQNDDVLRQIMDSIEGEFKAVQENGEEDIARERTRTRTRTSTAVSLVEDDDGEDGEKGEDEVAARLSKPSWGKSKMAEEKLAAEQAAMMVNEEALKKLWQLLATEEEGGGNKWVPEKTGLVRVQHVDSHKWAWVSPCGQGCSGGAHSCGQHPFSNKSGVRARDTATGMKGELTKLADKYSRRPGASLPSPEVASVRTNTLPDPLRLPWPTHP